MHLSLLAIVCLAALCINYSKYMYADASVSRMFSKLASICATDVPSESRFTSNFYHCGSACTARPLCNYFSYTKNTARCLVFDSTPTTFAVVVSCVTYGIPVSRHIAIHVY